VAGTRHHPRGRAGLPALEAVSRRVALLALLFAILAGCAPATVTAPPLTSPRPVTLAVITWNMHRTSGDLPRLVDDLASGRLTGTPPANYLLLLQEAPPRGPHAPAVVAMDRPLKLAYQLLRSDKRSSGNGILSTLPLDDVRLIDLPRERMRRGAVLSRVTVAGTPLFVVCVHLENRVSLLRGLLFSDGPRARQTQALLEQVPAGHGMAGGDLNTWLGVDEPALKAFAARFPNADVEHPQPTVAGHLPLDHLFFDLPAGWTVERRVLPSDYDSDHRPVLATIAAR